MPRHRSGRKRTPPPTSPTPSLRDRSGWLARGWVAPLLLLLLTAGVYARSLGVPIHDWDDHVYFFRDTRVETPTVENLERIFTQPFFSNYHPITTLTISFDRALWKTWIPGFHLTHLVFYAGGVLGLYALFVRILRRRGQALAAAAVYAVHTVHVESVAWLASRKDVVCLFFYVFALLGYVRYVDGDKGRWRWYALSLVLSAAAMLSKGYAVILPALLLAYDFCFQPRMTRRHLLDKVPYAAIAAATTLLTVRAQDQQSALIQVAFSAGERFLRLAEVFALYVGHTLLPIRLSAIYTTGIVPPNPAASLLGVVLLAGMAWGFVAWRRRIPAASFGIALYLLPLATVMNLVYTLRIWMTDRYLLFPTIGSSLLLVALARGLYQGADARGDARGAPRREGLRRALAWAAVLVVVLYSALTVARIGVWSNGVNLWSDVLRRQLDLSGSGPVTATELAGTAGHLPDPGPLRSLMRAYDTQGNAAEAARLEGILDQVGGTGEQSEMKLARVALVEGRYDEALTHLRPVAAGKTWFAPLAMFRIGVAEERLGHADASREAYARALRMYRELNQPATDAYFEVGTLEYLAGRYDKAAEWYRLATRESPTEADSQFHLGLALQMDGHVPEAMSIYRRIDAGEYRFKPHSRMTLADVSLQMATSSETLGQKADAIRYYEEVLRRNPAYPKRDAIQARLTALRGSG